MDEVYLQFDGLDDAMYKNYEGRPLLEIKLRAIENLKNANVQVSLVPTLVRAVIIRSGDYGPVIILMPSARSVGSRWRSPVASMKNNGGRCVILPRIWLAIWSSSWGL